MRTVKKKDASLLVFEAKQTVVRVEKMGDLFAPLLELKQRLPDLRKLAAESAPVSDTEISLAAQAEEGEEQLSRRKPASNKAAKRPPARKVRRKV